MLYYVRYDSLQSNEGNIEIMETAIKSNNKVDNFNNVAAYNNKSVILFKLSFATIKEAIKNYNISIALKPDLICTSKDKSTISLFDLDKYENGIQEVVTAGEHRV
ncbi:hypothetical protein [Candidatus Tisiphia endosymbiont of Nemotelus uliginosus]|uniref:hypothetical protein n=1 Tax=Candidatus Tisiphia endosymbiont of Nemotelus uliginosus TaxID=3077926 RepID=UPI0035C90D98